MVPGTQGFTGEGTGTTRALTVSQIRAGGQRDAREFGAIGDGTHDDTAALRAAFNCGVPLRIPAGSYRVTSPIATAVNQIILAEAVNAYEDPGTVPASVPVTQIVADNTNSGFAAGSAVLTLADRATISGFGIQSAAGVDALAAPGRFVTLHQIYTRYGRYGANLSGIGPRITASRFCEASSHGLVSFSSCTDGAFLNSNFSGNAGVGAQFLDAIKHVIIGCTFEWNTLHGVEFFQSRTCTLTGCSMDRNSQAGVHVSSSSHISVLGNTFSRNGVAGAFPGHVWIEATCSNFLFAGNNYIAVAENDDGSGAVVPSFTYGLAAPVLSNGCFAEFPAAGNSGVFADLTTQSELTPMFVMSPASIPGRYADDAAAAANGVPVGSPYQDTAGIFRARVS